MLSMNEQKIKKSVVLDESAATMLAEQAARAGVSQSALMSEILDRELFRRACAHANDVIRARKERAA